MSHLTITKSNFEERDEHIRMLETFDKEWEKIEMEYYSMPRDICIGKPIDLLDAKVVIFGIGDIGYAYAKKITDGGIVNKLVAFCDNNKSGVCDIYNVPIISLEELVSNPSYSNTIIVIAAFPTYIPTPTYTPAYSDEIYNQCVNLGIENWRLFICYSNLEVGSFELGSIDVFKKDFFDGYKWAYEFTKKEETKRIIIKLIKEYLFYYQRIDSQSIKNYREQIEKMKYRSCRYIEYFYLRFGGEINSKIVKFCCAHLEDMADVPAVYLGKEPKETLNSISKLRKQIIAESIAFSLLSEETTDSDRNLTAGCIRCNMYYLNNWHKQQQDLISNIALSVYPAPCQSRCIYCDVHNSERGRFDMQIHRKTIQDILDTIEYVQMNGYISPNDSYHIVIGEITIHPLKSIILKILKNKHTQFGTNGFIYDEEIVANPHFGLYFSIDAGTPETWKKVKGIDNFTVVLDNLRKYSMMCKKTEKIVLKYVILPGINDDMSDFEGLIQIMKTLNNDSLIISGDYNIHNLTEEENKYLIIAAGQLYALLQKNEMKAIISALSYSHVQNEKIVTYAKYLLEAGII